MHAPTRPERLNYAISRRCVVECRGCYELFGRGEPDRAALVRSAAAFAALGVEALTLSGGDPLLLPQPLQWISELRAAGMRHIKLDTVGVGLLAPERPGAPDAPALLAAVDALSIPLDGWNDVSVAQFRRGRADLHTRTRALLADLDAWAMDGQLVINTVVHAGNVEHLPRIAAQVMGLRRLGRWNLFQYTPTDQAQPGANDALALDDARFEAATQALRRDHGDDPRLCPRSIADRLGDYLLVNSDGQAWLPDRDGRTVALGAVFGREAEVIARWSAAAARVRTKAAVS